MSSIEYDSFEEISCVEQNHKINADGNYVKWSDSFIEYCLWKGPFKHILEIELNETEGILTYNRDSDLNAPGHSKKEELPEHRVDQMYEVIEGLEDLLSENEIKKDIREDQSELNQYLALFNSIIDEHRE